MSDKNNVAAFLFLFTVFIVFIGASNFVRYHILQDFEVYTFTTCDPDTHSCFINDPAFSGFSFYDGPYVKVSLSASDAPLCLDEHNCRAFSCEAMEKSCEVTYCSKDVLEEGEICTSSK